MKARNILAALLLMVVGLHNVGAQGFRVYNNDGTVLQFSLRTDSIVFYDGIGSEQDLGLFTPVNQMIVGTWYKSKSESVTFNEDGTTNYNEYGDEWNGGSYEFFPFQGNLVIYSTTQNRCLFLHVAKLTKDSMIMGRTGASDKFYVYTRTQPSQLVTSIVLNETSITLEPDEVKNLTATIFPEDADNPSVTWESSNEDVAEVNKNGRVIANGEGQCTITCSATDGSGVKAECRVTCSDNSDYISYCPTWWGFTYTTGSYPNYFQGNPRNVYLNQGDSIHITACQKERGHLINATYYTWTLCVDTIDASGNRVHANIFYNQRTNYDGYVDGANDPVCHMRIPESAYPNENGNPDTIKFVARYDYSGHGVAVENGNIVDNTSYSGCITPQSGLFGGGASGAFYFNVNWGNIVTNLVNGNFESWGSDTEPTGWKSASSASNATLRKSTEARNGSYACILEASATQNKRLATQEITLNAGSYTFSFYAKSSTSDPCQARGGMVNIKTDNTVGTYKYSNFVDINNNGWTLVSYDFDLTERTTLCLLVINPKNSTYSVSQDILIDDALLVKK